jgi:hypothetical protein
MGTDWRAMVMREDLPLTDSEWERVRHSSFEEEGFIKGLDAFDSIRHIAGGGEFASIVHADVHRLKELAGKVFAEGERDCAGEMFSLCSSLKALVSDLHGFVLDVRDELDSLSELAPRGRERAAAIKLEDE